MDRKTQIERAALELFVEKGMDRVSVREIADKAGMSLGNLYAHFEGKDALASALFLSGYGACGAAMAKIAAQGSSARERIEAIVRLILRLHEEDTLLFRFLLLTQHVNLAVARDAVPHNPIAVLQRVINDGVASGEFCGNPAVLASSVVGIATQAIVFQVYDRLDVPVAEIADEIVAHCMKVLS